MEYGPSIKIEPRWLEGFTKGGDAKRQAIQEVMRCIEDRLRELTLTAPDFETLSVSYTALFACHSNSHSIVGHSND